MKFRMSSFKIAFVWSQSPRGLILWMILWMFSWDSHGPQNWRTAKGLLYFITRTHLLLIWNNAENPQSIHSRNYCRQPDVPGPGVLYLEEVFIQASSSDQRAIYPSSPRAKEKTYTLFPGTFCLFWLDSNPVQVLVLSGLPSSNKPWRKKQLINTRARNWWCLICINSCATVHT